VSEQQISSQPVAKRPALLQPTHSFTRTPQYAHKVNQSCSPSAAAVATQQAPPCCPCVGPAFLLACRFAAGEYLDAAFLTKLMCVGRELHDFLTLPAQVWAGGPHSLNAARVCCMEGGVAAACACWR
jgi:hypothetical protein